MESMPYLWNKLDFSRVSKDIKFSSMKACVRRSNGRVTQVILPGTCDLASKSIPFLLTTCKRLEHLEVWRQGSNTALIQTIQFAQALRILAVGRTASIREVSQILENCPLLEQAEFPYLTGGGPHGTWPQQLPRLQILKLGANPPRAGAMPASLLNLVRSCGGFLISYFLNTNMISLIYFRKPRI